MRRIKPKARKTHRNPLAKALGSPLFKKRIVKRQDGYVRRGKHRKGEGEAE